MQAGRVHEDRLYIQLKNNAVYLHSCSLTEEEQVRVMSGIALNKGRVQLKQWKKVR